MKQIKVNGNCSGCGLCIVNCSYLHENADGNAEFIAGKSISDNDLEAVKKVISECPQNALKLVDTSSTNKEGTAGVQEIIAKLKKECEDFSVPRVTERDIPFKANDCHISAPYCDKELDRDYNSESAARSAAKEEFRRLCYSETAYGPILKKIFVEYKVRYLKTYYTLTDTEDSAYFKYNRQIRELLANVYAEITDLIDGKVPEIWKGFSVCLHQSDSYINLLMCFDDKSTNSGIISQMKGLSCSSLNDYVADICIDSGETYVGEGMFGSKFKRKYYYDGVNDAIERFIDNLTWAVSVQSPDITDDAVRYVNYTLEYFEKKVKEELNKKITELEGYLDGKKTVSGNSTKGICSSILSER